MALVREHSSPRVIALSTWWFWTASNATTSLYAIVVLRDATFALLQTGNTVCGAVVVDIARCKRRTYDAAPVLMASPTDYGVLAPATCAGQPSGNGGSGSQNGTTRRIRPSAAKSMTASPTARVVPSASTIAPRSLAVVRNVFSPLTSTKRQPGQFL